MFRTIDYKQKRIGLILLMLLVIYIAYLLSFRQTIVAIATNIELGKSNKTEDFSDSNMPQIQRKNSFYEDVLKGYRIRMQDSENNIWQSVSGMALSKHVLISFNPDDKNLTIDTTELTKDLIKKQFFVRGNYFNITRFLDTLSRAKGIGRLSALNLSVKKNQSQDDDRKDLSLAITLVGKSF